MFKSIKKLTNKAGRKLKDATQLGVTSVFILSQMVIPFLATQPVRAASPEEECGDLSFLVKYEANESTGEFEDTISDDGGQDVVTFSNIDLKEEDDKKEIIGFDWNSTIAVDKVVVFAGGSTFTQTGNELDEGNYHDDFTPTGGTNQGVSHVTFCYDEDQEPETNVEVIKKLVPSNDDGLFDLRINNVVEKEDASHNGTTGKVVVDPDEDVDVDEIAGTDTSLSDYETSIECYDEDGQGNLIDSGDPDGSNSRGLVIEEDKIEAGDEIICIITNTRVDEPDEEAELTLKKIIDGGDADQDDFTPTVNDETEIQSQDVEWDETLTLTPGEYEAGEETPLVDGYTLTDITCYETGYESATVSHPVNLEDGDDVTCEITNKFERPGHITVKKVVKNDDGGDAEVSDFNLYVNNDQVTSGDKNEYDPDEYTVTEDQLDGYKITRFVCKDKETYARVGQRYNDQRYNDEYVFELEEGQHVVCLIVNDDVAPELTLIKIVEDSFGDPAEPEDWLLSATPEQGQGFSGFGGFEDQKVKAHVVYTLSEDGPSGYAAGEWQCSSTEGTFSQPEGNDSVKLSLGADVTCTITNSSETPKLRLKKIVVNDNGGDALASDFWLKATYDGFKTLINEQGDQTLFGNKAVTDWHDAEPGKWYRLSEHGPDGYKSGHWECDGGHLFWFYGKQFVKLDRGDMVTCEIVNDDKAPELKIKKVTFPSVSDQEFDFEIVNDDGNVHNGYHVWNRTLDTNFYDNTYFSSTNITLETAGSVEITEDEVDGWANGLFVTCKKGGHFFPFLIEVDTTEIDFEIGIGEKVECTFKNVQTGDLVVTKFHDANENGEFDENETALPDWDITLDKEFGPYDKSWTKTTDEDGEVEFEDLIPNEFGFIEYELSEDLKDGWRQTNIYCEGERHRLPPIDIELDFLNLNFFNGNYGGDEEVAIHAGETTECFIGNAMDVELLIDKTNDAADTLLPGAIVNYTITVFNPEDSGIAHDSEVRDVLPDGFIFTGNYSVHSNVRGDITAIVAPDYDNTANLGVWQFDEMVPGEVVTITYEVQIGTDVAPGEYDNIALAEAKQCVAFDDYEEEFECVEKERLFARDVTPETEDDIFVESTVRVGAVLGEEDEGEVLAVTGVPAVMSPVLGGLITLLAIGSSLSKRQVNRLFRLLRRFRKTVTALGVGAALVLFSYIPAFATGNQWILNVADLDSTSVGQSVNLPFSVLSTATADDFSVSLEVDGPGSNDQTLGPISVDHGGGSGGFNVDFPVVGVYKLTVMADNIDQGNSLSSSQAVEASENTSNGSGDGTSASSNGRGGGATGFAGTGGVALDSGGVVSDAAATDSNQASDDEGQEQAATDENGDEATEEGEDAGEAEDSGTNIVVTLLVLAGLGALLYYYFIRQPNEGAN